MPPGALMFHAQSQSESLNAVETSMVEVPMTDGVSVIVARDARGWGFAGWRGMRGPVALVPTEPDQRYRFDSPEDAGAFFRAGYAQVLSLFTA